jgi:hypothetical protein
MSAQPVQPSWPRNPGSVDMPLGTQLDEYVPTVALGAAEVERLPGKGSSYGTVEEAPLEFGTD